MHVILLFDVVVWTMNEVLNQWKEKVSIPQSPSKLENATNNEWQNMQ